MTRVRLDDVKRLVKRELAAEVGAAAGSNRVLSQSEQAALTGFAQSAAQAARENAGPIISTTEVLDAGLAALDGLVHDVNQATGTGRALLSRDEVHALAARNPDAGARVKRAYDMLASGPDLSGTDGATIKARIEPLLGDLVFGLLSSEGEDPITAFHLPGQTFTKLDRATFEAVIGPIEPTVILQGGNVRAPPLAKLVEFHDRAMFPATAKLDAEELVATLRQLKDLTCFIAAPDDPDLPGQKPVYIVGIAGDGTLAGIKTSVAWT